jgi:predicted aconitase with swiveling domain
MNPPYPPKTEVAGRMLTKGDVTGEILVCSEGLSFWGGVDPDTGVIIDIHHPRYQKIISGKILMMPSSRGSCSGSGVLLELSLKNIAPAAIFFCEAEEILSLGALVSEHIFRKPIPVARLTKKTIFCPCKCQISEHSGQQNSHRQR